MDTSNQFTVDAHVQGRLQKVNISTSESSDGVSFYVCHIEGREVTQIRKDDSLWKQIWGDCSQDDVNAIGAAIEGAILNQ